MAASLIFDIGIALICLIIIIRNAARGFLKSFITLMKSVLAIFLAYLFNAPLARGLSGWFFKDLSYGWVRDLMLSTDKGDGGYALYEIFDGIPEWFTKITVTHGIDEEKVTYYFVEENLASQEIIDEFASPLGNALSMLISTVIAFISLFIIIEIVLFFVGKLLDKVGKLPIFRTVNIILGALVGVVVAVVIAWLISTAILYVFDFGSNYYPDIFDHSIIEKTVIVEFFEEHNLFTVVKGFFDK
ncbi:MAG: CvpA family protein [Clostridia bacterium]|nr:CvpA family protein [Clostridia bacterium]